MRPIPAHLVEQYRSWTRDALDRLALLDGGAPDHAEAAAIIAHDIKGMGASFGFPLMTSLGQQLCQCLAADAARQDAATLPAYIAAMRQALDTPEMSLADQKRLLARLPQPAATTSAHDHPAGDQAR